ncbi:unnamed protein product, partial [Ilex paraguariensis]
YSLSALLDVLLSNKLAAELDSGLGRCKDEFNEFERQDVKYREDLKHMKQKIKETR